MNKTRNSQSINFAGASGFSIGEITNVAVPAPESPSATAAQACHVLLLGANPGDTSRLRLDRESRAIDDALRSTDPRSQRFELHQGWASSAADVQQDLLRHRPSLVHYSGHGTAAGELVLEARRFRDLLRHDGASRQLAMGGAPAQIAAIAGLLARSPTPIRCVLFNACHSAPLAEEMANHADCAIGMVAAVQDDGAIDFAWGFYHALAQGESVAAAFDLGIAQLAARDPAQRNCPRLYATRCDPTSISWPQAR
jgi:hypothetical protein